MKSMDKSLRNYSGWLVFAVGFVVFLLTTERAGSLWDCGEFVSAAYKLQVVHPPGAPLFILIGRVFSLIGGLFVSGPTGPAFGVNLLSGVATAFSGAFVCWATIRLVDHIFKSNKEEVSRQESIIAVAAGVVAGLSTMLSTSIWFSAVEGEVYALSLFFLALTLWSSIKWYTLPDDPKNDKWLVLTMYAIGLSVGVHLLSLLVMPVIALMYYFKRYKKESIVQMGIVSFIGAFIIYLIQKFIITGIPWLWMKFEIFAVNGLGLPFHFGLFFALAVIAALLVFGLRYAKQNNYGGLQLFLVSVLMLIMGYSTIGVVVIRANAGPPINMSAVTDVTKLLPYLNREQYGERPILKGPQFDAKPIRTNSEDRYGKLGDRYAVVDQKLDYVYREEDKVTFPRMSSPQAKDENVYRNIWMARREGSPTGADNFKFFTKYQLGWMYFRYFGWNFIGRQNFDQGFYPTDKSNGNWMTGIAPLDQSRLYDMSLEPADRKNNPSRNKYYGIPFILGLIGLVYHFKSKRQDAFALLAFFVITGVGLIIYSNQPPLEPRERDYVLVGSFMAFCIWIGLAVPAIYSFIKSKASAGVASPVAIAICLVAPMLMGFQNWDDSSRRHLRGASDYGKNYLLGCEENALLFSYGDNDTYPVWYAQEVEECRTDIRPINMSLIGIDYYIDAQRRAINKSPKVDFITPPGTYYGNKRNYLTVRDGAPMPLSAAMKFVGEDHPVNFQGGQKHESYFPTRSVYIDVDKDYWYSQLPESARDTSDIVDRLEVKISGNNIHQGDLAALDMLAANFNKRPIYYTSTSNGKLFGLSDYLQSEGMSYRLVPVKKRGNQPLIAKNRTYETLMNRYQWGNFDKYEMYVDDKFTPAYYSHAASFAQTANAFANEYLTLNAEAEREEAKSNADENAVQSLRAQAQDSKQKAIDLCLKYFEVFPPRNFGYQPNNTINFINTLSLINAEEALRTIVPDFAQYVKEYLDFYTNMDQVTLNNSQTFRNESNTFKRVGLQLKTMTDRLANKELTNEVAEILGAYAQQPTQ